MREYYITVNEALSEHSVEATLKKKLNLSDNVIKKIKFGCIYKNGKLVDNINDKVNSNDEIKIILPTDTTNEYVKPNTNPLKIVYEDDYLLAVYKPKGMLTHNSKGNNSPSLDGAIANYFAPNPFTFRPINRLDRDTSGIVLIAKDMISANAFNEIMKKGEIKKTYFAIIVGVPKENHFIIDAPIDRLSPDSMKRIVSPLGKTAKSECLSITNLNNGLSLAKIILHTGRTHQIRVHFAHIGYPLYADALYGEKIEGKTYTLHAGILEFIHPFTKEKITLSLPI